MDPNGLTVGVMFNEHITPLDTLPNRVLTSFGMPFDRIHAAGCAFAAILANATIVTWGDPNFGGDSRGVQAQLQNVQRVYSTYYAFAAVCSPDGSVATWGDPAFGGNSSGVQDKLIHVQHISGSIGAFVAVLSDGSVLSWGNVLFGADSSAAQGLLRLLG